MDGSIEGSLAALGIADVKAVDALIDADGAAAALDALRDDEGEIVFRVFLEHGEASEGFGPAPKTPAWVKLRARPTMIRIARGDESKLQDVAVTRIHVERRTVKCCDAPSCTFERSLFSTWLDLASEGAPARVLVSERLAPADASSDPSGVGARLAKRLEVPIEGSSDAGAVVEASATKKLTAGQLARFALREEGDRFVLRDHGSVGPRASASRNTTIGVLQLLVAVAAWIEVAVAIRAGDHGVAIGAGAVAALLTLSGYAFVGVARFSSRYVAGSNPCVVIGNDKLVVAPWVSRSGAIDLRPEGRLGAAIPLHEVRGVSVKPRGDLLAVEIATDHGPMDALATSDAEVAAFWSAALARAIDLLRHPKEGATARQRARAKAHAAPSP